MSNLSDYRVIEEKMLMTRYQRKMLALDEDAFLDQMEELWYKLTEEESQQIDLNPGFI